MRYCKPRIVITLCVIGCATCYGEQRDESPAETLKRGILGWLNSITSVECEYTFRFDTTYDKPIPEKFVFKTKGDWIFFSRAFLFDDPRDADTMPTLRSETNVNGKIDCYFVNHGERFFHTRETEFSFLACNTLCPLAILGRSSIFSAFSFGDNLLEFLNAPGFLSWDEYYDLTRLYVYPEPQDGDYNNWLKTWGAIVYLDADRFIRRVEYVIRPQCSREEIAVLAPGKPPQQMYQLFGTDYFDGWVPVGGISFPTRVRRVFWQLDESKIADMSAFMENLQLVSRGEIGACQYFVRKIQAIQGYVEETVWTMDIDPATLRINNPNLTRDDFVISPVAPDVYWNKETNDITDKYGTDNLNEIRARRKARLEEALAAKRHTNWVPLASTVLLLASATILLSVFIMKRRS